MLGYSQLQAKDQVRAAFEVEVVILYPCLKYHNLCGIWNDLTLVIRLGVLSVF